MKTLAMFAFVVAGVMLAQKPTPVPNREAVHQSRPTVDSDDERQADMDEQAAERDQEMAERDQEAAERDQEAVERDQEAAERDQEAAERDRESAERNQEIAELDRKPPGTSWRRKIRSSNEQNFPNRFDHRPLRWVHRCCWSQDCRQAPRRWLCPPHPACAGCPAPSIVPLPSVEGIVEGGIDGVHRRRHRRRNRRSSRGY